MKKNNEKGMRDMKAGKELGFIMKRKTAISLHVLCTCLFFKLIFLIQ